MSTTTGLLLTDPAGSKMLGTRIDDLVFTFAFELAPGETEFRVFEDDRVQLRAFLAGGLVG